MAKKKPVSLTRELLLENTKIEVIEAELDGEVLYIKPMSEVKRSTRASQAFTKDGEIDPKFMSVRRVYTIIDHLCDSEGNYLFSEKDLRTLGDLDGAKLDRYFAAINSAIEKIEGNA